MEDIKVTDAKTNELSTHKKVWNIFTTVLTILIVLIAVYCIGGIINQTETGELFFPFGHRPVVILSGSMEDTMQPGAIALVKRTEDVHEGDMIFFISNQKTLVIHRYIDTDENGLLITKGDANPVADFDPIHLDQVYGKVIVVLNWTSKLLQHFI